MNTLTTICRSCGRPYHLDHAGETHMNPPDNYAQGCATHCLACWLGVGPDDFPEAYPPGIAELVHTLTCPCADNGLAFIRTERLTRIRELLALGRHALMAELPLALLYRHRHFDPAKPAILVSSHIDSLYTRYHSGLEDGILTGTYDNSITNAAIIDQMLAGRLSPQVLVAFTGDEEADSRGADQVVGFLGAIPPAPVHPELVVVLDVTEEAFGSHPVSFENLFVRSAAAAVSRPSVRDTAALEGLIHSMPDLADPNIVAEGDPDESLRYRQHNLTCLSLCLPILPLTGYMHDDDGVQATLQSLADYAEIVSRFLALALHAVATRQTSTAD